jgi:hypothetical protein
VEILVLPLLYNPLILRTVMEAKSLKRYVGYRVSQDAPYHKGRLGFFEFLGGPEFDVAVMCDPVKDCLFAVDPIYLISMD